MENNLFRKYTFIDYLIIGMILIISAYIYYGFFFVDPYSVARFGKKFMIVAVWGARVFFPILVILIVFLYHLVKIGKLSKANLILMFASIIFSMLVMYPFGEYIYNRFGGIQEKLTGFHPYLQLKPNDLVTFKSVRMGTI